MLKVHVVLDLGWEDSLTAALVQRHMSEIRIIEYLEFNHTSLDAWSLELRKRPYNWGRVWLPPSDGFSASLKSKGKSVADILTALGWDVVPKEEVVELSVDQGIRNARMNFHRIYFDQDLAATAKPIQNEPDSHVHHTEYSHRLLECLRRYRRHINKQTGAPMTPARDAVAHGADTLRYITNNADLMENEPVTAAYTGPKMPKYSGGSAWML
jgi:phage terminase large subunit